MNALTHFFSGTAVINTAHSQTLATPQFLRNRKPVKASADDDHVSGGEEEYEFGDTVAVKTVIKRPAEPSSQPAEQAAEAKETKLGTIINTKRLAIHIPAIIARSLSLFNSATPTTSSHQQTVSSGTAPTKSPGILPSLAGLKGWRPERRLSRYLPNDRCALLWARGGFPF